MNQRLFIVCMAAMVTTVAAAQESGNYQCTYGDMQRRVEIAHEPGVEVPCSVHYYKDTEMPGEQQVLWSADRDPMYCKTKALQLVEKLEGWGWDCDRNSDTVAAQDPAEDRPDESDDEEGEEQTEEMLGDPGER